MQYQILRLKVLNNNKIGYFAVPYKTADIGALYLKYQL